jgi:uncharacterized protein (UPF0276 family)
MEADPRALGIGVVYSPELARVLDLRLVDVLEIEPQVFWRPTGDPAYPYQIDLALFEELRALPQQRVVHSIAFPVGNSRPHDAAALACLTRSVAALDAPYASEHLSFDTFNDGGEAVWTGFFLPPRQTAAGVQTAAARLDEMRRALGVPVAFETGVNYLRPREDELDDGAFFRAVAQTADCGILLDLHNLLANERNGRETVAAVVEQLPRERIWEIHLAGGMPYRGYWLDSHTAHIEPELVALARAIVPRCPSLRTIVFEMLPQQVPREGVALRDDLARLRELWSLREGEGWWAGCGSPTVLDVRPGTARGCAAWEDALGAAVAGRVPSPPPLVGDDPAVALYADLVASVREGTLAERIPLVVRLLELALGREGLLQLIGSYGASAPPQRFSVDEARGFLTYLRGCAFEVPHLSAILALSEAINERMPDQPPRRVGFDGDAGAVLDALARGTLPVSLPTQATVVEVGPDGLRIEADV